MIPKGKSGRGFKGAANYLLHDKGGATTSKRVEWTQVENMRSDQSKRAWQEMLWTSNHAEELKRATGQKMTGRKAEKPVYHLSLSWAKDETPTKEAMIAAGKGALKSIGLEKHQALYVCHNDEPQPHIHILVNRVDHETGLMNTLSRSNRKLSAWAMKYELRQGKVLCEKRLENSHKLEQGNQPRHKDQNIKEAWERSDSGKAFEQALAEKGYVLAQGTKRIVVVDPYGKVMNPTRHLYGVKAADIRARLTDLDTAHLPKADAVRKLQIAAREAENARTVGKEDKAGGQQTFDHERRNEEGEKGIIDAGSAKQQPRDAREEFDLKGEAKELDKILNNLTGHQAVFSVLELQAALEENEQNPALVKTLEQDGKILRLHERESGEATDTFTTPEVRAHEQSVLDCAERLTNRPGWQIEEGSLEATSARRTLDAEQRAAMTHALSPKGLTVIEGRAGTGKSHTLGAVREALTANDYRVIGLAPTNTVAIDLQKDGFSEARTVHSLLWHIDHQRPEGNLDKNTVLVVDEAAMLDTNIMDRLLQEAERGKSKVILVGDDRQLASVSRGGMFGAITDRLGSAEITKVRRQREAWDRQAAQDFATGRFADGVEAYEQHGRIHWTADLEEARTALVKQWAKDTQDGIGNRFVFGYTNEEVDRLNQSLRQVEIERGRVDSSRSIEIETERFGTVQLAKGDRVQFRSNDKPQGIVNGLLGTVQQISADGAVQVLSDNGRSIAFSAGDERCPEVQHGYAGTLYRGQGKTLDEAYLLHTYHWRDRPSYVAMTRARGAAKLFVARDQARGVTALVRQMGRSSDRGSSLQFSTAEDLQNREASGRKSEQHERIEKLAGSVRTEMQSRQIDETSAQEQRQAFIKAARDREAKWQGKIELWANRIRADRQTYQFEEIGELGRKHSQQMAAKRESLDAFYGEQRREDENKLEAIRERQEKGGLLYRVSGQEKKNRLQTIQLNLNIEDSKKRQAEALNALRTDQRYDVTEMEKRHEQQREADERRIAEVYRNERRTHANENNQKYDDLRRIDAKREEMEKFLEKNYVHERKKMEQELQNIRSGKVSPLNPKDKKEALQTSIQDNLTRENVARDGLEKKLDKELNAFEKYYAQRASDIENGDDPERRPRPRVEVIFEREISRTRALDLGR